MDSLQIEHIRILTRSDFWAIMPDKLPVLIQIMLYADLSGAPVWEAAKPYMTGTKQHKIAVIPVEGVLTKDGPAWLGSNYNTIAKAAEDAASDPSIKRIVLATDSPGGEVMGVPETAAVLAQVAKIKPVSAMVEGLAASAAYWLTSQASDITITPSGEVGSVGIKAIHMDISKMLEDAGVKVTEMYSGYHKTEWSKFKPLSDEAKAYMQGRLETAHGDFLNAVTSGRGNRATDETKAGRFGEGRMFRAQDALSAGMVDHVQAARDFYRTIAPPQEQQNGSDPLFGLPVRATKTQIGIEREKFDKVLPG